MQNAPNYRPYLPLHRVVSTVGNPIPLATLLVMFVPLIVYLWTTSSHWLARLLWLGGLMLVLTTIVLTAVRFALIVLVIQGLIMSDRKLAGRVLVAVSVLIIPYSVLTNAGTSDLFMDRLMFRTSYSSFSARVDFLRQAFHLWTHSNYITGLGFRLVPFLNDPVLMLKTVDNAYATILLENGVLGFVAVSWLICEILSGTFSLADLRGKALFAAIISFLLMGFIFDLIYWPTLWVTFWLLTYWGLFYRRKEGTREDYVHPATFA